MVVPASASVSAHSLADLLRSLDESALARLLTLRPDLATPAPASRAELIERATGRASVEIAMSSLDAWALHLAGGLAAFDGANEHKLATGFGVSLSAIRQAMKQLTDRALVWGKPAHLVGTARAMLGPFPLGLAAPSPNPRPQAEIDAALEQVGAPGREVLARLIWGPPTGAVRHADRQVSLATATTPIDLLLAHKLLRPLGSDQVLLPREVALRLRQGRWLPTPPVTVAPPLGLGTRRLGGELSVDLVDRAGIGSAQELVSHLIVVVDAIADAQPTALHTGALGRRQMVGLARLVGGDETLAHFVLELAAECGFIVNQSGHWLVTTAFDSFLDADGFHRWAMLDQAWARLSAWPPDQPAAGLDPSRNIAWVGRARAELTAMLTSLDAGARVGAEGLAARLGWLHPAWPQPEVGQLAAQLVTEANWLGLLAFDRRTVLAVTDNTDPGFASQGDQVVLQSDLTAIAPAPLDRRTTAELAMMAQRESHGATGTYRFSTASLRHALDAGWEPAAIADWLNAHSLTGVPQPLSALLDEVSRSFGRVRVQAVGTVVQFDDEAAAVALLRHPSAAVLGCRQITAGVVVALADAAEVVPVLHELGLAPVAFNASGGRYLTLQPRRVPAPAQVGAPEPELGELARRLSQS